MISVHAISKSYGRVRAVREVSFALEPGQVAGLLGPNGAGKSTTIRMITGFLCPDRGSVSVGGHDTIADPLAARRLIGYLPESAPSYPEMRAIDYIVHRAKLYGFGGREARRSAQAAADRCRIGPMLTRRIGTLSKGYKQRVGLAAALVHDPKVLILDEPTNGLDPTQIREARSLMRELASDRTMLVSSHILPEIERTCDRVIMIVGGRLCADGSPTSLASSVGLGIRIECRGGPLAEALVTRLGSSPAKRNVRRSDQSEGWVLIEVDKAGHDERDQIARWVREMGVEVRELSAVRPTLEDAFVRHVESAAEGAA